MKRTVENIRDPLFRFFEREVNNNDDNDKIYIACTVEKNFESETETATRWRQGSRYSAMTPTKLNTSIVLNILSSYLV